MQTNCSVLKRNKTQYFFITNLYMLWLKGKRMESLRVFATNSDNQIPISLQPKVVDLRHFKIWMKTLEWWISGLMLNPLFFLISRLNIACSPLIFNLQINYPIMIKYPILKFSALITLISSILSLILFILLMESLKSL